MDLNQVTIPSTNITKSITFYEKLGLQLIVHTHDAYARFELLEGSATFSLHLVEKINLENGSWIYFEIQDLDNKVKELKENGLVFEQDPKDEPWLWREAKLRDPDNNLLILYTAGENRKNPPWKLKK